MDPERWNRVKALFHEALERPAEERDACLAAACEDDAELRAEVESLLRTHAEAGSFLEWQASVPSDLAATRALRPEPSPASRIGERLGAYELVRHLGSGGMGTVYLARRADGAFEQDVAIKVVKRGMDTEAILRRFHAERQILAGLDHPNICRLLDGGATADGLPYFVMEHIDGETIDAYCRRHDLPLARRLDLFLDVCHAVQYAHQNLVVHRDLKPRNILVTRAGQPKLVDFGIAKFLGPGASLTQTEGQLMTPEYASPEQVRGEPVTTATDVHALGILLYELVAEHHPFARDPCTWAELSGAILDQTPAPPSQVVDGPPRRRRALRGDLDNITLMALRKDPARRYASAAGLAADVRRHLRSEPVIARPDSVTYRAAKFVGRHRLGVAVATAFVLALGAFSLVTARQAALVARERDTAAAERDKANRVSEFLIDLFEVDPLADDESVSDTTPLRDFLTRSEGKVRKLGDQPELKATLLRLLTRLYGNLGRLDRARELGEEALALRQGMGDTGSDELASTLTALATVRQDQGDVDAAADSFRRVLAIRESLHPAVSAPVAEAVNNLAVALSRVRRPETVAEVEALARRGLALRTAVFGPDHADTAQSLNVLASFLYFRRAPGDLVEAEKHFRAALAIRVRRLGERHPSVAITRSNYANALRELGRLDDAEAMFRAAIDSLAAALPDHPYLAHACYGLHTVLVARGDLAGAEAALRRAVAIDERTLPEDHPWRVGNQEALADLLRRAGKPPDDKP